DGADWEALLGSKPTRGGSTGRLWALRLRLLGHPPAVSAFHPAWPDFHLAYRILRQRLRRTDRLLVVSASPPAWLQWLRPLCRDIEGIRPAAIAEVLRKGAPAFDACLWAGTPEQAETAAVDRIGPMLKPGGGLFILLAEPPDAAP